MMRSLVYARGNPYLLMLWLGMLGSCIVFMFLFLVFISRVGQAGWVHFAPPTAFVYSTLVIVFSSVSLHLATVRFRMERYAEGFLWLLITVLMAVAFCLLQVAGWVHLQRTGVQVFQISGAFLYLLSGLHLAHIAVGATGLVWVMVDAYIHRRYVDGFIQSLNPTKAVRLKMVTIFWHFLGLLWLAVFALLWFGL